MKTMWEFREHVDDHGGDASLGVSFQDLFEKAAEYVDKILQGTNAGSLPIFEPASFQREEAVRKKGGAAPAKKKNGAPAKKKKGR